jgi:hypothetical protein
MQSTKYNSVILNTCVFSFWWGFQFGLSAFGLFSQHSYVFPLSAAAGSLISGFFADSVSRLKALGCIAVGCGVGSLLVRGK